MQLLPERAASSSNRSSPVRYLMPLGLVLIALILIHHRPVWGQGQEASPGMRLSISGVDRSRFPEIGVNLIVTDAQSRPVNDLSALRLWENGVPIADFQGREVTIGVDLLFVLDGSARLLEVEDDAGLSRLQLIKDAIQFYSGRFMDVAGRDRISLIVPNGQGGEVLAEGISQPGELIDTVVAYSPQEIEGDGAIEMIDSALSLAEAREGENGGRFQAIVLFTDGLQLNPLLTEDVVERARQLQVPIFVLLLGPSESESAVERISSLTVPTRGSHTYMPGTSESAELFQIVQDNADHAQAFYETHLSKSGTYPIDVALDEVQDETVFDLSIEPPQIEIGLSSGTIRRSGTQPDTELFDLQPTVQPIPVRVTWPDGMPRRLVSMSLMVNGEPQDAPVVGNSESLQFDWDISQLDEGRYTLSVQVTDSLGLNAQSEPIDVTVDIVRPQPLPTPTATATPSPMEVIGRMVPVEQIPSLEAGSLLGAAFLAVLVLFLVTRQLSTGERRAGTAAHRIDTKAIERPAVAQTNGGALLQPVEQALAAFPLVGANVTVGRSAEHADVVIADETISLLHARIRRRNEDYWLYDEGSEHGTLLNFERLGLAPRQLADGDEIQLGRVRLRFYVVDASMEELDAEE